MKHPWLKSAALLLWLGLLVFTCGVMLVGRAPAGGPPGRMNDKVLHATVFGIQTGIALLTFRISSRASSAQGASSFGATLRAALQVPSRGELLSALAYTAFTGALLELLQSFTATRQADFADWIADCVGGILVLAALRLLLAWGQKLWKRG